MPFLKFVPRIAVLRYKTLIEACVFPELNVFFCFFRMYAVSGKQENRFVGSRERIVISVVKHWFANLRTLGDARDAL